MVLPSYEEDKGQQTNPGGNPEEGIVLLVQANLREPYALPDRLCPLWVSPVRLPLSGRVRGGFGTGLSVSWWIWLRGTPRGIPVQVETCWA